MTPPAFLALWNGVLPERRAEYEAWHSVEHMPERIGAPGFLGAQRYRAEAGDDYFTLYELMGLAALETPAYAALMQQPTAWSLRMRPALTGFRRLPCRSRFARRLGRGGALLSLRLEVPAASLLPLLQPRLEAGLRDGALLGAIFGEGAGKPYPIFPDAPVPGVESLLLLEATEPAGLAAWAARCCADLPAAASPQAWRLLQSLRRQELADPDLPRQPPRAALQRLWDPDAP